MNWCCGCLGLVMLMIDLVMVCGGLLLVSCYIV